MSKKRRNYRLFFLRSVIILPFIFIFLSFIKYSLKTTNEIIDIEVPVQEDTVAPEIALVGKEEVTILVGEDYTEQGFSALDNGIDITGKVDVRSNLNEAEAGNYTIEYYVEDEAGNSSTKTRKVIVEADYNFNTKDPEFYLRSLEHYIEKKDIMLA